MKEERVLINGLETNYKIAGSGPAILLLHGWGGSSSSWVKIQEILGKKGYQVIVPDFPGFGKSADPFDPWGVKEYVEFVFQFVKELKLNSFFLLGHSFGGRIAIKFSALYPEKVLRLVLVDSAGVEREKNLSLKQKIMLTWSRRLGYFIVTMPVLKKLYPLFRRIAYILVGTRDYYLIKSPVMKETFKKIIEEDLTDYLPMIKVKTLIIWGEKDRLTPISIAHLLKEKITGSELEVMPGIGHNPHLQSPKQLSEIILKFFK
ncbi:MAG: alpha/beta hydrolase [Candidatus Nealsonbacteria bacterium]|nr:alpha/beta hydrolase [Candidatus Nealsonbacteria bacterium]